MSCDAMRKRHQPGCPCCDDEVVQCKDNCCAANVYGERNDFNQPPWQLRPSTTFDYQQGPARNCWLSTQATGTARVGIYATLDMSLSDFAQPWLICVTAKMKDFRYLAVKQTGIAGDPEAVFDLQNGVVVSNSGTLTETMEDLGDGWYSCQITADPATHSATGELTVDVSHSSGGGDSAVSPGEGNHIGAVSACLGIENTCDNAPDHFLMQLGNCLAIPNGWPYECAVNPDPPVLARKVCDNLGFGGEPGISVIDTTKGQGDHEAQMITDLSGYTWRNYFVPLDHWEGAGCATVNEKDSWLQVATDLACTGLIGPGDVTLYAKWFYFGMGNANEEEVANWEETITLAAGQKLKDFGPIVMTPKSDYTGTIFRGGVQYDRAQNGCAIQSNPATDHPTLTITPDG